MVVHSVRDCLKHILEATQDIQVFTAGMDAAQFLHDRKTRAAVVRCLEIVGEACRNIQRHHPQFAAAHPEFPLRQAAGMRNALIHGYFDVDWSLVWDTVKQEIPALQRQTQTLLAGP